MREHGESADCDRSRRVRPVRLCAPDVLVDRRPDGTLYLKSSRTLPPYPDKLTDRLVHWARARARPRVHGGARAADGWRTITYAQTLDRVRRIGAALLKRDLSPERPIVILSGNDLEHALLGLAANYVGIPYAPVSPAYSLISSDFGKLRHIVDLLTPGLVFACDGAQYARAIEAVVPPGRRSRRRAQSARTAATLFAEPRCRARRAPMRRMRASRPTRSRNSSSPPARPACRRA